MLQQVTAWIQPMLAAQVNSAVSLDRTRMVNITLSHHFCSCYMTKHISHSRSARYLSSSTHIHISKRCVATALRVSSSITTGHHVLNKDVDPKRLGSENKKVKNVSCEHDRLNGWNSICKLRDISDTFAGRALKIETTLPRSNMMPQGTRYLMPGTPGTGDHF